MKECMKASDIAEMLGVSEATARKMIQRLNRELREQGYLTVSGRVSTSYFTERYAIKKRLSPQI